MFENLFTHHFILGGMLFIILLLTVLIVFSTSLLRSIIFLMLYSLVMALIYLLLAAPDVAMTEAAIGACISTVLFLSVLPSVGNLKLVQRINAPALVICIAVAGVIIYATLGLPDFGNPNSIPNLVVSPYYINHSAADMGIPNIVTAVLASYRGFDTLGETYVIFTAAIAVLGLFSYSKRAAR